MEMNSSTENSQKAARILLERQRIKERERRARLTAIFATIHKVFNMAIPLLTLKITYDYLNAEIYGLWTAVLTFFSLFAFSDFGLGNGLQTKLSQASGQDDLQLCKKIISNTYYMLLGIAVVLIAVFVLLYFFVDWASVMNAKEPESISLAGIVVAVIVLPKLIGIPVGLIQRVQLALQEGYLYDLWCIVGCIASLVATIVIAKCDLGKVTLLLVTSALPIIFSLANMLMYFKLFKREYSVDIKLFDFKFSTNLLSLGISFCFLSVLTTIGLSMDTFVVARTCSLVEAGAYSVLYRCTAVFAAVIGVFSVPLWGAFGEALGRGDVKWVWSKTKRMSLSLGLFTIIASIIGCLFAKPVFRIWLGEDFAFSYNCMIWLCIQQILFSFISPFFMVLNADGSVMRQVYIFLIYTPLCFLLKFVLSNKYGIDTIPIIGAVLYATLVVPPTVVYAKKTITTRLLSQSNEK